MVTHPQTATISLEDFIAAAEATDERLEFVDGDVVSLAGTSWKHGILAQRIARMMGTGLRGAACEVVSQGTLVKAAFGDNTFLPDVAVACGPRLERVRGVDLLLNPVVVVEVLSPSTERYDRTTKWDNYRGIPSVRDFLLVSQDAVRVEWFTRLGENTWLFDDVTGPERTISLGTLGVELSLAEVYEGVLAADERSA